MDGVVKFYNKRKCYGFIIEENNANIFFHKSGLFLEAFVEANDKVEYDVIHNEHGRVAVDVKKV